MQRGALKCPLTSGKHHGKAPRKVKQGRDLAPRRGSLVRSPVRSPSQVRLAAFPRVAPWRTEAANRCFERRQLPDRDCSTPRDTFTVIRSGVKNERRGRRLSPPLTQICDGTPTFKHYGSDTRAMR